MSSALWNAAASPPPAPSAAARRHRISTVTAVLLLAGSSAVLLLAAWLHPDRSGVGTHEQLGLPPCGFFLTTGLPCATCGMTTAFAYAAHGQLWRAVQTQPAGALLAVLTAVVFWVSLWALITGASLAVLGRWLWRTSTFWLLGGAVLLAWAYKIGIVWGAR